jgi:hypothetical protein
MKNKRKWLTLAAVFAVLFACLWLFLAWFHSRQRPGSSVSGMAEHWVSDIVEPANKVRGHLTVIGAPFGEGGELVFKATFEVAGDPTRLEGIVGRYKSQASGEGKITVTLVSKIREGKEIIKEQDRRPAVWHVKKHADDTLEIRRPYPVSEVTFRFRKEK